MTNKMRPSVALQNHREAIREIALRHRVNNVRVFGSVLHGDDTDESDLDYALIYLNVVQKHFGWTKIETIKELLKDENKLNEKFQSWKSKQ